MQSIKKTEGDQLGSRWTEKQGTEDEDLEKAVVTVPDKGKSSNMRRNNNVNWL